MHNMIKQPFMINIMLIIALLSFIKIMIIVAVVACCCVLIIIGHALL
jgi:hypothetical protein